MLYTIILQYIDDSYAYQIESENVVDAILEWMHNGIEKEELELDKLELDVSREEDLRDGEDAPTKVQGLRNVWCYDIELNGEIGIIHVIETKKEI